MSRAVLLESSTIGTQQTSHQWHHPAHARGTRRTTTNMIVFVFCSVGYRRRTNRLKRRIHMGTMERLERVLPRTSLGATMMSHDAITRASSSPAFHPTHTTPSTPRRVRIASPSPTQTPTTRGGNASLLSLSSSRSAAATAASYHSFASRWTCCTAYLFRSTRGGGGEAMVGRCCWGSRRR